MSTSVHFQKSKITDPGSTSFSHRNPEMLTFKATGSLVEGTRLPVSGGDEPTEDTVQLFFYGHLLRNDSGTLKSLTHLPTARGSDKEGWIRYMENNPQEKEHLFSLMNRMASQFVIEPTNDPDSIREVVLIGPLLDKDRHRELVRVFVQKFQQSTALDTNILLGLVQLVRDGPLDSLAPECLIPIITSCKIRLEETTGKGSENTIYLSHAIAVLLTALIACLPKDHHLEEYRPLLRILSALRKHKDPLVKFQARYTRRVLISVSGQRGGNGCPGQSRGMRGLYTLMRRLVWSHSRTQWFQDVQKARKFVRNHHFSDIYKLINGRPSDDTDFQWHICQILGEIVVDPTWIDDTRHQALTPLQEYANADEAVKSSLVIKRWALTILRHIPELSTHFYVPQAIYKDTIKENNQELMSDLGARGIKPFEFLHPLMGRLPLPTTSPILHEVSKDPDVEVAIDRLLRQRSIAYDRRAIYIQLLSKQNIHATEDVLIELQERATTFLGSRSEVLLVLGDSGAGKSTFGLRLENELWTEYKPGGPIPFFIDLKTIDTSDKDMVHQHLEDLDLFSDEQIEDMRRSRQFVLICDGYDEYHKWTNLHTKNYFNRPRQWQAKMIISCRTQYLGPNYRHYFEPETPNIPNPDYSHTSDRFEEAVIVPFRISQIEEYVELFTQVPETEEYLDRDPGWSTEQYMERLRGITHLMELAKNPFMLKMILDVLPTIAKTTTKMTRVELYDRFVELHFKSEHWRLVNQYTSGKMDNGTLSVFTSLKDSEFIDRGLDFSKRLSHCMFKEQKGVNSVTYSVDQDGGSWKDPFFGFDDDKTKLMRRSAQLVCRENKQDHRQLIRYRTRSSHKRNSYEFSHRSILEYFYSCLIFDPRGNEGHLDLATCLHSTESPPLVVSHPFGQTNIVSEPSIVHFLAERVQLNEGFQDQLQTILQLSKAKETSQAATNAITILVRAGERFNGTDLKGIRVPGADLSGGDFDSAQLQGADLRNTILRNVWMHQADLSNSLMEGATFGEYPYLELEGSVKHCAYSRDGKHLTVGINGDTIFMYDTSTWNKVIFSEHNGSFAIDTHPPNEGPRVRGKIVQLLDELTGAIVPYLGGHTSAVSSVAYSPSGNQIASGSWDETVRLCDAHTGALTVSLGGHTKSVTSVAYSPSGNEIVSGSQDMTVRLWDAQSGVLTATYSGHSDFVSCVIYSPSGRQIASGSWDMTVRLWDAKTGALAATLNGHTGKITSVAYSPTAHQVVSGSHDRTVRLWDAQTGVLAATLIGHAGNITSVAYSPTGKQMASSSWDKTVRLWDPETGLRTFSLTGHTGAVIAVAYSPSGDQIASGGYDMKVRLWDSQTGANTCTLSGHALSVLSVTYSPSGHRIVSGSYDKTLRLWDLQTATPASSRGNCSSSITPVAFSPNGHQIVSGSKDKKVRLWDTQSGTLVSSWSGHTDNITSVAFSPNGHQIASGSNDKTVRLWDAQTGAFIRPLEGHRYEVTSVGYSPDGHYIVSGSHDWTVRLWDSQTGAITRTMEGHGYYVSSVAYSPSGHQIASGSWDKTVRLWDSQTGLLVLSLSASDATFVYSVAYSPNGSYIASGSLDKTVRLWDVQTGALVFSLGGHTLPITSVTFSPSGHQIASCTWESIVRLWDVPTSLLAASVNGHTDTVFSIACSPGSHQIASGSRDKTVQLWDSQTGALISSFSGHADAVNCVAYSPSGHQIASVSSDWQVRLWDPQSRALVASWSAKTKREHCSPLVYSPSGRQIASGVRDNTVRLWNAQTGAHISSLTGHKHTVSSVAYSPTGHQIASGCWDKTVRLWDAQTGALVSSLNGHTGGVTSVVYSPRGSQVASGSWDHTVRLWDPQTGALTFTLSGHTNGVECVAYSSASNCQIASAGSDRTVRLWDMDSGDCLSVLDGFQDPPKCVVWRAAPDGNYLVVGGGVKSVCSWKVVKNDDEQVRMRLHWRSANDTLFLRKASIQGVQDLSDMNRRLLRQRGAIEQMTI